MEEVKLNFLLMGKTGQGKSATGNTLLDRKEFFKTSPDSTSETKDVNFSFRQFEKYMLQIVDGPGLEDTKMDKVKDKERAINHIETAITMCYGGVSAFLYTIKFGERFTAEERSTLDSLKTIFGKDFMKHVIVVITGGDLFQSAMEDKECDISFDEWCRKQKEEFHKLYEDCEGRFVLLNNRERDNEKKRKQIQEIVLHATNLQKQTGFYTSQCFETAEKGREKMIVDLKVPQLKIEIQKQVTLLAADLVKYSENPSEIQQNKIRESVQELRTLIKKEDKGYNVLGEMVKLVDEVDKNMNDRIQLKILASKLEDARKAATDFAIAGTVCTIVCGVVAFAVPPVGAALAAGTLAASAIAPAATLAAAALASGGTLVVGAVGTGIGYLKLRSDETSIEQQHDELNQNIK